MLDAIRKIQRHVKLDEELVAGGFVLILVLLAGVSVYGYLQLASLSRQVTALTAELSSTTELLTAGLADATTSLATALQEQQEDVESKLGNVESKVGAIGGTVTDLQKLSKIDPELLKKYSKVFFLSENYAPAELADIPPRYRYNEQAELQLIPQVLPYLTQLLREAEEDGIPLYIQSAYRSFSTQGALKGQYTVVYGAGTANQFSADQGYSEHQLGTTVDFITTGLNGQLAGFDRTPAYTWLLNNAHRYGFVLSYPKNNAYYVFEPWHWRFVGEKLARDLHATGSYFYNLDQRTIDTYLISLFD